VQSAIEKAKAAAGEKDVTVVGGANTAQQLMNAGRFDELHIGIVPIVLGSGLRFFENVSMEDVQLDQIEILESPSRTDIKYRVVKKELQRDPAAAQTLTDCFRAVGHIQFCIDGRHVKFYSVFTDSQGNCNLLVRKSPGE